MDLEDFRREYLAPGLHRKDLDASPFRQFESWLKHAIDAGLRDPTAMAVATVDARGRPSQRLVLLKHCDERGFVFYTNLESRKAREIAGNARVALLFPWADMERQVRIEGTAERMGAGEALKYFLMRPRASQLAAWASAQVTGSLARSHRKAVPRGTRSSRLAVPPQPVVTAKRVCTQ